MIVCIGDVNIDLVTKKMGSLPAEGTEKKTEISSQLGGEAAITAKVLSSLGENVHFFGRIGKDIYGKELRKKLEEKGVVPHLQKGAIPTSKTLAVKTDKKTYITDSRAKGKLENKDISKKTLEKADSVFIGGYWHLKNLEAKKILKESKESGKKTYLGTGWNYRAKENKKDLLETLEYTDHFFANDKELNQLTGKEYKEAAEELPVKTTAVHLGRKGCFVHSEEKSLQINTKEIKKGNFVGAGDAFNAGFTKATTEGKTLKEAGRKGNRTAKRYIKGELK